MLSPRALILTAAESAGAMSPARRLKAKTGLMASIFELMIIALLDFIGQDFYFPDGHLLYM